MIDTLARILGTLFLLLSAYVILVQWYAIIARLLTRPERRKSFSILSSVFSDAANPPRTNLRKPPAKTAAMLPTNDLHPCPSMP